MCNQPQIAIKAGCVCFKVLELSDNIRKQIPENIDYEQTLKIMMSDTSPLKTVLLQEVSDLMRKIVDL